MRSKNITQAFTFPSVPEKCVRLHLNESKEVLPQGFLKKLRNEVKDTLLGTYPSISTLRQQVAEYAGVEEGQVLITAGSDQGIELLMENYFEGKKLALQEPSFLAYKHLAEKYKVNIQSVEYQDFIFSLDHALQALEVADGIALSNPGNPIGIKIEQEDLETVAQAAQKQNKICIFDEAYFEFLEESFISKINTFENVVLLRTFSKAFGLAGLRVGYLIASKEKVAELQKLQLPCPISSFAILAASTALKSKESFNKTREKVIKNKILFESLLKENNFELIETCTNFSNIRLKDPQAFANELRNMGVVVMPLQEIGLIRVAIPAKPKKIVKAFIKVRDLQNH